ncbi:hypothetical protein FHP05_11780 [Cerasibacillus terrae]|uniref:Prepilin-type N-terminal cleavage/methylation domain-containing protein n=1 Tax=Cerasibacillus terrae TaxID=2498845 RepID=A0A5C8NN09_9BACI|nr:hypothetical protein [Cerasibacillus terrae]TXL62480.1 hypothetical protein FHP05_11780 [Cerasibacillus terrae]
MNKNIIFQNEKGLTLVEILATTVLLSIIIIFISSLLMFAQKQFSAQTEDTEELFDVTYVSQMILKDVRKATEKPIVSENKVEVNQQAYEFIEHSKTLEKNGVPISKDITSFTVELEEDKFSLSLISQTNKKVETMIMIRGADCDEEAETEICK